MKVLLLMNMPGHDHSQGTSGGSEEAGGTTMGMKAVDATDEEQKSNEN